MKRFALSLVALIVSSIALPAQLLDLRVDYQNALWTTLPTTGGSNSPIPFGSFAPSGAGAKNGQFIWVPQLATGGVQMSTERLIRSVVGGSFSGGVPDFYFGDTIAPPVVEYDEVIISLKSRPVAPADSALPTILKDLKEVRPGAGGAGGATVTVNPVATEFAQLYYSIHAEQLFASQSGPIDIYWESEDPIDESNTRLVVKQTVLVSASPSQKPKTLYWTEAGALGSPVEVAGGVRAVNILYNADLPEEFGEVDPSNPNANRTFWFDNAASGQLRAHNREGRVIVEFLGAVRESGSAAREFIGYEIVDVKSEVRPTVVDTFIGDRLQPSQPLPDLIAAPVNATSTFYESYPRRDGRGSDHYATRLNAVPLQVLFFWTEPGVAGTRWPRLLDAHRFIWPEGLADYAPNIVLDSGSPPVNLPTGSVAELVYQDDPDNEEAEVDNQTTFVVDVGSDQTNRALLRFQTEDRIWFQRVFSMSNQFPLAQDSLSYIDRDGDGERDVTANVEVGQRIEPPLSTLSPAGYINTAVGNAYNPGAYQDPFAVGFEAAESGAIIPVNALPGKNELEVWWFTEIQPPFPEFSSVMWPAYVGRYTVSYPSIPVTAQVVSIEADTTLNQTSPGAASGGDQFLYLNDVANEFPLLRFDASSFENGTFNTVYLNLTPQVFDSVYHQNTVIEAYLVNLETWDESTLDFASAPIRPSEGLLLGSISTNALSFGTPFSIDMSAALQTYLEGQSLNGAELNIALVANNRAAPAEGPSIIGPRINLYSKESAGEFPENAPTLSMTNRTNNIVIASNRGSGRLEQAMTEGSIYYQNDAALPGYNPNEEHALMLNGTVWALRDDLNQPITSQPFALLDYTAEDGRPAMAVFPIIREYDTNGDGDTLDAVDIAFRYEARAGTILQAPMPLPLLYVAPAPEGQQYAVEIDEVVDQANINSGDTVIEQTYDKFTFTDRKDAVWVKRGTHNPFENLIATESSQKYLRMEYRYPVQPGFYFPDQTVQPDLAAGRVLTPFLRARSPSGGFIGDSLTGAPLQVEYRPVWGDLARPTLNVGDTLTTARFGLPDIINQTSVQIVYDGGRAGSEPTEDVNSAFLWDPLQFKFTDTTGFDDDTATEQRNGETFAQDIGPELQTRFYAETPEFSSPRMVLEGRFIDAPTGSDWLLPNVLSAAELASANSLLGSALPVDFNNRINVAADGTASYASYALTNLGEAEGYMTLVFGNGPDTPEDEPVSMEIIYVGSRLGSPEVVSIYPENPLSERVNLRLKNDFAGDYDEFEYQWRYAPPNADGTVPFLNPSEQTNDNPTGWLDFATDAPMVEIAGASLFTLSDNFFIARFREKDVPIAAWSEWSRPQLVEGWIKRVLGGINPFQQRTTDFFNNPINTSGSIIAQAGPRWEGNIALSLENIEEFGLIEIYETVSNRGKDLSIDGSPAIDYGPANDALLLVAGYLNDLYMQLGNEAYADAANPTIAIDATAADDADVATSLFAFQGQVGSLLEEELALLRGRDDSLAPAIDVSPAYNRLYWNYTGGIASGEPIYALNYNIREIAGPNEDGSVDALDAQRLFPQGHGDAYGHYLTALKNYYDLLTDSDFTWTPRIEAVDVLGQPVSVDYQDERKFAAAASAAARTAYQVLDLTQRQSYRSDATQGWSHLSARPVNTTTGRTRAWGVDDSAARGIQGAYFNWLTGNSIVPADDSGKTGIQRVDRSTVPELAELPANARAMQAVLDSANAFQNPLGLAENALTFDISPAEIKAGKSHFEQIYERAERALANAGNAFSRARSQSAHLRTQEAQLSDLQRNVTDEESTFNFELIELYGRPYAGDVGAGKIYPQGYNGPDLVNFRFIDETALFVPRYNSQDTAAYEYSIDIERRGDITDFENADFFTPAPSTPVGSQATARFPLTTVDLVEHSASGTKQMRFSIPDDDRAFVVNAESDKGSRPTVGLLQSAYLERIRAKQALEEALDKTEDQKYLLDRQLQLFEQRVADYGRVAALRGDSEEKINDLLRSIADAQIAGLITEGIANAGLVAAEAAAAGIPTAISDAFSGARGLTYTLGYVAYAVAQFSSTTSESVAVRRSADVDGLYLELERELEAIGFGAERRQMVYDLEVAYSAVDATRFEINRALSQLAESEQTITRHLLRGERLQAERESFRRRAAALVQGYRTNDLAFRLFRNEALEQYKTLFDLAARYSFLAAKAYDYETGLLGTDAGREFLDGIVQSRALGVIREGRPQFAGSQNGDPGLSGKLAKMDGDWSVVEGRLGFNNPDTYGTNFSLRSELFRILNSEDSDTDWRSVLESYLVDDLLADPDVAAGSLQLARGEGVPVPGFIIPFSTTVQSGRNFFGLPLAAGDSNFSASAFATKIYSVGVVFDGYEGMNPFYFDNPDTSGLPRLNFSPNALSATPYVYLLPTGSDIMRSPPLGDGSEFRIWDVYDQALPLPFNLGANDFANGGFFQSAESLIEDPFIVRKHQAFRAVDNPAFFFTRIPDDFTNSRLIGRSVWNTEWKLVIPAYTLLNDEEEAIERFLRSVHDIKLHLKTYSYSGN